MPVDPLVQAFLDQIAQARDPEAAEPDLATTRQTYEVLGALNGPAVDLASVVDEKIDGPGGAIPVRVYTPRRDRRGLIVYFHGGGWTIGSITSHDAVCRLLADGAGAVVASVDYRLAPEHPFPAALDDAWAAVGWAAARAAGEPLAVAGDSAGGNLAAVCCLLAREAGGPEIAFQLLVYPVVDATFGSPSYEENGEGYVLERRTMEWFRSQYLGAPPATDLTDPRVSPLHAADLAGLPPALVITAEFDPLRDEGEAYAARLAAAGVDARASRYDGMIHAFFGMGTMWPRAADAMAEACAALRSVLSAEPE